MSRGLRLRSFTLPADFSCAGTVAPGAGTEARRAPRARMEPGPFHTQKALQLQSRSLCRGDRIVVPGPLPVKVRGAGGFRCRCATGSHSQAPPG